MFTVYTIMVNFNGFDKIVAIIFYFYNEMTLPNFRIPKLLRLVRKVM